MDYMYSIVDIELCISLAYWHVDVHVSGYVLVWCGQSCRVTLQLASAGTVGK